MLYAALGVAVTLVCAPRRAAAGAGVALRWSAPAGCPDQLAIERRVTTLAGPGVVLEADASMTEEAGRLRVVLHVKTGNSVGERVVVGDSCQDLAESAAVILAMSSMSAPAAGVAPPPAAPPPSLVPFAPFQPAPIPRPMVVAVAQRPLMVRMAPLALFDIGTLPHAAAGGGIQLVVAPGPFALGVAAAAWATNRGTLSGTAEGADFKLATVDGSLCYAVVRGSFELSACTAFEFDHVFVSGVGEVTESHADVNWFSLRPGARVRWELTSHLGLAFAIDAVIPTTQHAFLVAHTTAGTPQGQVYRTGAVAARGALGPEVRF